jgi:hypothetical protein
MSARTGLFDNKSLPLRLISFRSKSELLSWLGRRDEKELSDEYELVSRLVIKLQQGECAAGHRVDNRHKNRQALLVPPDAHRPYISSFQVILYIQPCCEYSRKIP